MSVARPCLLATLSPSIFLLPALLCFTCSDRRQRVRVNDRSNLGEICFVNTIFLVTAASCIPFTMSSTTLSDLKEKIVPKVKAEDDEDEEEEEEDLVDPAEAIKEACGEDKCSKYKARLDECNDRVNSKSNTTESCLEEILDFYHCVDHCAADKIFKHVK